MARCGNCGRANREGALFCQDCGKSLETRAPADSGDARPLTRVACGACGEQTPSGFSFCQHCGARIGGSSDGVPKIPTGSRGQGSPATAASEPRDQLRIPSPAHEDTVPDALRKTDVRPGLRGRLITLRRDGSDGETIQLAGEIFDVGRGEGDRCFPDDVYMAPRHARFVSAGGATRVRPLDLVNGVYLQVRSPTELASGDTFYVGRELLQLELLSQEEREPPTLVQHGVRIFGSLPRESWGRLRQISSAGITRDLWHLSRSEVRIGREEGDIVFPDDEFMSRRHVIMTRQGHRVRIEDQHSSNGTYVRLRGEAEVQPGDVLRLGDQVLRFEK